MGLFQEGNYDVESYNIPYKGMNQNISPQILPFEHAYVLENILPIPLGRGQVRFGTRLVNGGLPIDSDVIKNFPFLKNNGFEQRILYVSDFIRDISSADFVVNAVNNLSFTTDHPESYRVGEEIKINYSGATFGATTTYCDIEAVTINEGVVTLVLSGNYFPTPIDALIVDYVAYPVGNIYCYDTETDTLSDPLNEDYLSVSCVPRYAIMRNTMILCNGVDRLLAWNGTDLAYIVDYVKENSNAFNRISASSFSFVVPANGFIIEKYPVGGKIILNVNGAETPLVVQTINRVDNIVTITTTTATVPVFAGQDRVFVSYADYPPPFNFLFVAHDRLWALGTGAASIQYRDFEQCMIVYYADQVNSFTAWFNERTKLVGRIDVSDKHEISDNLEAICGINNYIAFIGRQRTQIWQGIDPTANANANTAFSWAYNINVGIAHGNLLVKLANDINIVTDNGIVSLGKFNVAQQVGATAVNAVDPIIREYLASVKASNKVYRSCDAFKYKNGPFCGFKIGNNKILVSLYSTELYSWMFFSGDFSNASTISASAIDSLYLTIGNKIYKYADGQDGSVPLYGDQDGKALIPFFWTLPVVQKKGIRFANKRYEIQVEYGSEFVRNKTNSIYIGVVGDLSKSFELRNLYDLAPRGDILGTVPLLETSDDPNYPTSDDPGMRLDIPYAFPNGRLQFVASSFWLYVTGNVISSRLFFDKITLFGIKERRT